MSVIETWITVTSMLTAVTLLDHSTAPAIWDTLEVEPFLTAVSFIHVCLMFVKRKHFVCSL